MADTMRDYLKRQRRLANVVLGIGLAVVGLVIAARLAIGPLQIVGPDSRGVFLATRAAGIMLAWVVGLALVFVGRAMSSNLKCPKCAKQVGAPVPDHCSGCGLNFNSPIA